MGTKLCKVLGLAFLWLFPTSLFLAQEAKERATLEGNSFVLSVAFSGDGTLLASGHRDGMVKLWNVKTGDAKAAFEGHNSRSGGGGQAVRITEMIRADNDVPSELWEEESGQARVLFQGHDGVFRLGPEHPESARLRAALGEALRQKTRVWFIARKSDLALRRAINQEADLVVLCKVESIGKMQSEASRASVTSTAVCRDRSALDRMDQAPVIRLPAQLFPAARCRFGRSGTGRPRPRCRLKGPDFCEDATAGIILVAAVVARRFGAAV
jgi:hypothetical protein